MSDNEITTRKADVTTLTQEDYEMMAALSRAAFSEYQKESGLKMRGVAMTADMVRDLAEQGTFFAIVYKDGKAVAYGGCRIITNALGHRILHGEGLACHPDYRRLRLGWHIAQIKEDWGREQGADYFLLDTSCKAAKAIAFHKRNGYKVWGYTHHDTTNYYSVIMRKEAHMHWSEWERRRSVLTSWIKTHASWDEAGHPRRLGRFLITTICHLLRRS